MYSQSVNVAWRGLLTLFEVWLFGGYLGRGIICERKWRTAERLGDCEMAKYRMMKLQGLRQVLGCHLDSCANANPVMETSTINSISQGYRNRCAAYSPTISNSQYLRIHICLSRDSACC